MDDVSNIPMGDIMDTIAADRVEVELRKLPVVKRLKSKFMSRIYPESGLLLYDGEVLGYEAVLVIDKGLCDLDDLLGCGDYRVLYEACAPGECFDMAIAYNEPERANFVTSYVRSLFDGDTVMCMRDFRLSLNPENALDEYCGVDTLLVEEYIDIISSGADQVSRVIRLLSEGNRRGGELKERVMSVRAVKSACKVVDSKIDDACGNISSGIVEYRYSNDLLLDVMLG